MKVRFACAVLLVCLAGCADRPAPPARPAGVPIVLRPPAPARRPVAPAHAARGVGVGGSAASLPRTVNGDALASAHAGERSGVASEDAATSPLGAQAPTGDSPDQVIRDTAALNRQATAYVLGPGSRHAAVETLARLNSSALAALQRLKQHRGDPAAQASDVAAARASANAMASYLAKEAKPPALADVPPTQAPTPAEAAKPAP